MTTSRPPYGFEAAEFEARLVRAQALMAGAELDALVVTTAPNIFYFTGFATDFLESPTRPWFVVVPANAKPIAVIPEIGIAGMRATWLDDIRTWQAPQPADDGVSLLAGTLQEVSGRHNRIGMTLGHETHLRMPVNSFRAVCEAISPVAIADCTGVIRQLRSVKSRPEIEKIRFACEATSAAFEMLPDWAATGQSERAICQRLKGDLLERGVDAVPFMAAASGSGGYDTIIMRAGERVLGEGDLLIIDAGATFDGYYCDFDRNFAFGTPGDDVRKAYAVAYAATDAGIAAARPGAKMSELWATMSAVLDEGGALGYEVGRLGHGLGLQLTEGASIHPDDHTVLEPGMVITIEPGLAFAPDRLMVHEENVVIADDGAQLLTRRAPSELPVIS